MTYQRPLTRAEYDDEVAGLVAAAGRADRTRFESQLALGAILIQLQALREAHPELAEDRTFADVVREDFEIDPSRGYQFVSLVRLDEALRAAGEDRLTRESHARVVVPLLALPDKLVDVVRRARADAEGEGSELRARHLKGARRSIVPESYTTSFQDEPGGGPEGPSEAQWPWGADARDRFAKVPRRDRVDVMESLTFASLSEEVTPELVDEAAEVVRAERDERQAGRPGWPVVVGVAVAVVALNRRMLLGDDHPELLDAPGPQEPIEDLDYYVPPDADGYVPEPGAPRAPLLVVVPTTLCPDGLLDAHPGARELTEGRAEVVVEVNELEAFGGPFLDERDEHGHRKLDVRAVRDASTAAGIVKVLHPAGPGIEWAALAVNCCTGCSHGCARRYCYASDFALLYFPQAFVPTIWPARLDAFENTERPDLDRVPGHRRTWARTVFHGSMTDLMNRSFPDYWVQAVVDAIRAAPQWNVVVLTKLAARLTDFEWPANAVVGVTVTRPSDVRAAAAGLAAVEGPATKWVSAEPMLGPVDPAELLAAGATLFAFGAQTRTRWAPEVQPDPAWTVRLFWDVVRGGAYPFPKSNLDWRSVLPFGDEDPLGGWTPSVAVGEDGAREDRPATRATAKPKGPRSPGLPA